MRYLISRIWMNMEECFGRGCIVCRRLWQPGRLWRIEKPAPIKWLQRLRRLAQIKWYRQIRMLVQVRGVLIMIIKARSGKRYPAFWGLESV